MVVDVHRECRVRSRIDERLGQQHLLDRVRGRLDAPGARKIVTQSIADEVAE
jgi:hypothetical protein